jgi:hypothetical protein
VERSVLSGRPGLFAADPGTAVQVLDSLIGGAPDARQGRGAGIVLQRGAALEAARIAVIGSGSVGIRLDGAGTQGTIAESLIAHTRDEGDLPEGVGQGVVASFGASVRVSDSALVDNQSAGLNVAGEEPALSGSEAIVLRTIVEGTVADGRGEFGTGVEVTSGGSLTMKESVLLRNHTAGVVVGLQRSQARLEQVLVRDSLPGPTGAFGVVCADQGQVHLLGGTLRGIPGIALAISNAAANVDGVRIEANRVGLHVQSGALLREVDQVPSPLPEREVNVARTTFVGNDSKLGTGVVPLPASSAPKRVE